MRYATSILVVAGVVLTAAPVGALERANLARAQSVTSKGEKLLAKEDYARAEKLFRQAIEIEPALPSAHLGLGAALVGEQRFTDALEALGEAEQRFVRFEQEQQQAQLKAKQQAAQVQQEFKDNQQAVHGSSLSAGGPPSAQLGQGGGGGLTDLTADRLRTQEHLVRHDWRMDELRAIPAQVFYLEGISNLRSGNREEGMRALELALSIDPSYGLAHYNLAVALFSGGQVAEAKEHLDAAVQAGVKPNPKFAADLERASHK
jgi:tetratricopeptide (TPR) repeat protein